MIRGENQREKKSNSPSQKKIFQGKIVEIRHPIPGAKEVYLAGEFNDWDPRSLPMKKGKDGIWKAKTKLPLGRHEYKLIADQGWIEDLPEAERTENPFGTKNFIVRVE